jgi:tRNA-2-methylthio-N6-dimethylallyladenosine synthase
VPEPVKSERLARLFALSEQILGAHLGSLVGTTQRVLIEGLDKECGALWSGRTERNEIVHVAGAERLELAGELVDIAVTRSNRHSLQGELTPTALTAARPRAAAGVPSRRKLPLVASAGGS